MKVINFIKEVKHEVSRITWPSQKDTLVTVAMVFVVAILTALFFLVVDAVVYKVIHFILGVGA